MAQNLSGPSKEYIFLYYTVKCLFLNLSIQVACRRLDLEWNLGSEPTIYNKIRMTH